MTATAQTVHGGVSPEDGPNHSVRPSAAHEVYSTLEIRHHVLTLLESHELATMLSAEAGEIHHWQRSVCNILGGQGVAFGAYEPIRRE